MFETILVATDGSEHAQRAVAKAAGLAARFGSRVVLQHVLLRGHMPEGLLRAAQVEHLGERRDAADHLVNMPQEIMARVEGKFGTQVPLEVLQFIGRRILSGAEEGCRKAGVRNLEIVVDEGNAAQCVLECAERVGADLIVVGSRGLSTLKGMLMGSVSQKIIALADCPCLTVK